MKSLEEQSDGTPTGDSMGIICCGGRHFDCYPFLKYVIDCIIEKYGAETEKVTVISGHCRGADQLGERYAKESGTLLKVFPAEWTKYGKAAGPIRNSEMVSYLSSFSKRVVVAFKNERTKGTADTVEKARRLGYDVYECGYETLDDY